MKQSRLGIIYKVAYNPKMSDFFFNKLRLEIHPFMVSNDETTAQYSVDHFIQSLEGDEISKEEQEFLAELVTQEIDYIEI